MLTKNSFPVPAFTYPVRNRLTKTGPDPVSEDDDMKELRECADKATPVPARPPVGTTRARWSYA